ncbi:MAG: oligosaccharide flippase family protein [Pseudomonadota bacterium]
MSKEGAVGANENVKSFVRQTHWALIETGIIIAATIMNTIVLSRILTPSEFGAAAIALAIANVVQALIIGGFGPAIVRLGPELDRHLSQQIYTLVLAASLAGSLLCFVLAFPISALFEEQNILQLILVSSCSILFFGISSFGSSLLVRAARLRDIAVMVFVAKTASITIAISIAVAGGGSWALIASHIVFVFTQTVWVLVAIIGGLRPALPKQALVGFIKTSSLIVVENFVTTVTVRFFAIYAGLHYGIANLGLLNYALRLVDELGSIIVRTMNRVGVAYFSRLRDSNGSIKDGFAATTYLSTLIGAPIFMGLFSVIDELILLLSSEAWVSAIPMAKILCLYWIVRVMRIGTSPIYKALDKQSYAILISWAVLIYLATASFLVRDLEFIYVVAVFAARPVVSLPLGVWTMWRLTGASFVEQFAALMQPLLFAGIMLIVLEGVVANQITHLAEWESLIVKVALGAAIYLSLTALFDHKRILRLPDLLTGQVSLNARPPSK